MSKKLGSIHQMTWDQFVAMYATNEPRKKLLHGLERALFHLYLCGCRQIVVGGSYVTPKENPNDIDVAWNLRGVNRTRLKQVAAAIELSAWRCHMRYCWGKVTELQHQEYGCHFFVTGKGADVDLDGAEFLRHDLRSEQPHEVVQIDLK